MPNQSTPTETTSSTNKEKQAFVLSGELCEALYSALTTMPFNRAAPLIEALGSCPSLAELVEAQEKPQIITNSSH